MLKLILLCAMFFGTAVAIPCYPSASFAIGVYSPQCNEDKTWKAKQCWGSTGTCWCVNIVTGQKLTEPVRSKDLHCP